MQLKINGELQNLSLTQPTVLGLVESLDMASKRGVAIAVNDEVVPRSRWSDHRLNENDRVEIIRATQGG
jgi:sulfur carrier protein